VPQSEECPGLRKVGMSAFQGAEGRMGKRSAIALVNENGDRLRVCRTVGSRGILTQVESGRTGIHLCDRQGRRRLLDLREQETGPMLHGLRGNGPRTASFAVTFEQKVLARIRQRYADFGPTLGRRALGPRKGLPVEPGGRCGKVG